MDKNSVLCLISYNNFEGDVCIISKTIHTKRNHSTVTEYFRKVNLFIHFLIS